MNSRITNTWLAVCLAVIIGLVFKLYASDYFSLDDFDNLRWVQITSGPDMIHHVINPVSRYFRPTGMVVYWLLLRCCDLDPLPYHVLAWFIHVLNVGLVFMLLQRIVQSSYAAGVGALLFAYQEIFHDIYWNFGTIFELLCTCLFLCCLCIHVWFRPSLSRTLVVAGLFLFALKAKEMAITLPVVLTIHDFLQPAGSMRVRDIKQRWLVVEFVLCVLVGVAVLSGGVSYANNQAPTDPYYMVFSGSAAVEGYSWYLDKLFHTHLGLAVYGIALAIVVSVVLWRRCRSAGFFLLYAAITLSPVIPLVNHRNDFYWYLPFLGVSGLAAVISKRFIDAVDAKWRSPAAAVAGMLLFALLCRAHYFTQKHFDEGRRAYVAILDQQHRDFVRSLREFVPPREQDTLYFTTVPNDFSQEVLYSAAQVALRRTDVEAKRVDQFPKDARFCMRFETGKLVREPCCSPSGTNPC